MYGLLKLPVSSSLEEKRRYRKYMCELCGNLHKHYGVRARMFVSYDCTTLALMAGSLDEPLDKRIMSKSGSGIDSCISSYVVPSIILKFVAAISMMLAYCKFLDRQIDEGKKIPKWIQRISEPASKDLIPYGLDKSFLNSKLKEQHELERINCGDIETLSNPTSEILSRIFGVVADLAGKPEYHTPLKDLGFVLGKLIYTFDSLLDYHKDIKRVCFNPINACYFQKGKTINQVSQEIFDFLNKMQKKVSLILEQLNTKHLKLVKEIFLRSPDENVKLPGKNFSEDGIAILTGFLMLQATANSESPCKTACEIIAAICIGIPMFCYFFSKTCCNMNKACSSCCSYDACCPCDD